MTNCQIQPTVMDKSGKTKFIVQQENKAFELVAKTLQVPSVCSRAGKSPTLYQTIKYPYYSAPTAWIKLQFSKIIPVTITGQKGKHRSWKLSCECQLVTPSHREVFNL